MRIAVIEPAGRLYGSEYCLLDIIDGLADDEFSWRVFLPQGGGFDQLLKDRDIECEFLIPSDLGQLPKWKKFTAYIRILWRLIQSKPDILYVNQAGSLRSARVYARLLKLPLVCQVQTLEDAQWLSRCRDLHDTVQAFICNSRFIAEQLHCDAEKKCILYQGISKHRLAKARNKMAYHHETNGYPNRGNGPVLGILGRIAVSKGHFLLLDAAGQLRKRFPKCTFVVIGEGLTPDDTNNFIEAARQHGLEDCFEFRGYRQDLALELSRLDLLLIPSLAEPLGRVIFDAAEYGVPVVLSDAGGLGELGRQFEIGVSFKSGDPQALTDAVTGVLENYSETRRKFQSASLAMFERLSMDSYLKAVARILQTSAKHQSADVVWLGDS